MGHFHTNINIQTLIGLFFLVFCVMTALFGYLLCRFRFLDGKSFYFSQTLGLVLLVASAIFALAIILMLLYVRVTL